LLLFTPRVPSMIRYGAPSDEILLYTLAYTEEEREEREERAQVIKHLTSYGSTICHFVRLPNN
jgi:hypothetical protein